MELNRCHPGILPLNMYSLKTTLRRYHLCQERGEQAWLVLLPPHFEENSSETRSYPQLPLNALTATSPNIKSNSVRQLI